MVFSKRINLKTAFLTGLYTLSYYSLMDRDADPFRLSMVFIFGALGGSVSDIASFRRQKGATDEHGDD